MKSSREQFEEWARSSGCDMERYKTGINKGDFKNPVMRKMWLAWQAGRSSLFIKQGISVDVVETDSMGNEISRYEMKLGEKS